MKIHRQPRLRDRLQPGCTPNHSRFAPWGREDGSSREAVALAAQQLELSVAVVTPTAEQSFDLIRRLTNNFEGLPIEILLSGNRQLPPDLAADPRVPAPTSMPRMLRRGRTIVIGTVDKFFFGSDDASLGGFDLMVCDEAYQVAYRKFAPCFALADQFLFVGDPGQLPPLSLGGTRQIRGRTIQGALGCDQGVAPASSRDSGDPTAGFQAPASRHGRFSNPASIRHCHFGLRPRWSNGVSQSEVEALAAP